MVQWVQALGLSHLVQDVVHDVEVVIISLALRVSRPGAAIAPSTPVVVSTTAETFDSARGLFGFLSKIKIIPSIVFRVSEGTCGLRLVIVGSSRCRRFWLRDVVKEGVKVICLLLSRAFSRANRTAVSAASTE